MLFSLSLGQVLLLQRNYTKPSVNSPSNSSTPNKTLYFSNRHSSTTSDSNSRPACPSTAPAPHSTTSRTPSPIDTTRSRKATSKCAQVSLSLPHAAASHPRCLCLENGATLESIRESFTNTIDELNRELLAIKEAYDQLDDEKQQLADELHRRTAALDAKRPIGMLVGWSRRKRGRDEELCLL